MRWSIAFGLAGLGVGARFLEAFDGSLQERGVEAGRDFAVGRAGAVDEFGELAVAPLTTREFSGYFS
jgi:hypothetical protein